MCSNDSSVTDDGITMGTVAIRQALNIAWAAARGQVERVENGDYVHMVDLADRQFRDLRREVAALRAALEAAEEALKYVRDVAPVGSMVDTRTAAAYAAVFAALYPRRAASSEQETTDA